MPLRVPALDKYRDLIEQGMSSACAAAFVKIEYGIELTETQMALAERGPLPQETF